LHSALNANHKVFTKCSIGLFLIYSPYELALYIIILVSYISYTRNRVKGLRDSTGFNYIWSEKDKLLKSYWNVSTCAFFGRHGGARSFLKFSKRVQPCGRIILFKIPEASESGKPDGAKPRNFLLSDSYTCRRYVTSFPENPGREAGSAEKSFPAFSRSAGLRKPAWRVKFEGFPWIGGARLDSRGWAVATSVRPSARSH
jgi:hypothetical protein